MANKGGRRPGAGRPWGSKENITRRANAASILESLKEPEAWKWAYKTARANGSVRDVVEILKYLTDRRDGRPSQSVSLEGQHSVAIYFGSLPVPKEYADSKQPGT